MIRTVILYLCSTNIHLIQISRFIEKKSIAQKIQELNKILVGLKSLFKMQCKIETLALCANVNALTVVLGSDGRGHREEHSRKIAVGPWSISNNKQHRGGIVINTIREYRQLVSKRMQCLRGHRQQEFSSTNFSFEGVPKPPTASQQVKNQ